MRNAAVSINKQPVSASQAPGRAPSPAEAVARMSGTVRRMAGQMACRLPASVEVDDLCQAGLLGVADACTRYAPGHGACFETFAKRRARGAMLDELRAIDPLSRGERHHLRQADEHARRLAHELGRAPTLAEVATAAGQQAGALQQLQALATLARPAAADPDDLAEVLPGPAGWLDTAADPFERLAHKRTARAVVHAIEQLPEQQRLVLSLRVEQDMTQAEAGAALGVSASRVCQIERRLMAALRAAVLAPDALQEVLTA